jgi:hypothetical protein
MQEPEDRIASIVYEAGRRLGLVVNFGLMLFKQGIQRAANGMPE